MKNGKYALWDKKTNIITPIGTVFTPEEWMEKYPVAKIMDIVCGGGTINGSIFGIYDQIVEMYEEQGCNYDGCETKEDYIDRINEFVYSAEHVLPPADYIPEVDSQTRIADALEDLVALQLADA